MRLHFQERPWDLYLSIGYGLLLALFLVVTNTGTLLAVFLLLFVPGYLIVAALYPGGGSLDWTERLALSVALSLATLPMVGIVLNFTGIGVRLIPIVGAIAIVVVFLGLGAYGRRMRLPPDSRLSGTIEVRLTRPTGSGIDKALAVGVVASVILAAATLTYVVLAPRPAERFTEFYVLGASGLDLSIPTRLNVSQAATVQIGVVNHESTAVRYSLRVDVVGVERVFDPSTGMNVTVELNRTTVSTLGLTLNDSETRSRPYTFSIGSPGLWALEFLLYKENSTVAYRTLRLFVDVIAP